MPDFEIVDHIPNSADNRLVDYDGALEALKGGAPIIVHRGHAQSNAQKIVNTYKKRGGVKTYTRANAEAPDERDIYVELDASAAPEPHRLPDVPDPSEVDAPDPAPEKGSVPWPAK